ncbi:MAG: SCO family protein, partial [Flavobacteriaceae bacterium]|nr:SCO family protein [Flavobacteriaceae bacterium]
DFFFTTCQTICPIMTDNMLEVQNKLKNDSTIMLLSHSVTPEIDSVAQLKKYALKKGVDDTKWNLVTGEKKEIYKLARKSYLAVKTDGNGDQYDMIHTENFILVDKKKRIRGFYDGTDDLDIEQLLKDIEILKREN